MQLTFDDALSLDFRQDSTQWLHIEKEIEAMNLRSPLAKIKRVVQKKDSKKFFEFFYYEDQKGPMKSIFPVEGKEVFPKTIEVTIYN